MFSKALFKQSVKANLGLWSFVTGITCFMLAIVILVLGTLEVGKIKTSMTDMFVKDTLKSQAKAKSIDIYYMCAISMNNFEISVPQVKAVINGMSAQRDAIISTYDAMIAGGYSDAEARTAIKSGVPEAQQPAIDVLLDYYLSMRTDVGVIDYSDATINYYVSAVIRKGVEETVYNQTYDECIKTMDEADAKVEAKKASSLANGIIKEGFEEYLKAKAEQGVTPEETFAFMMDFTKKYISNKIASVMLETEFELNGEKKKFSDYVTKDDLLSAARNGTYVLCDILSSGVKEGNTLESMADTVSEFKAQECGTIIDDMDESTAESFEELGRIDLYTLVIGNMFFKISGLLLPIIYAIMCANNLISSQVDSGSMAYVLSTPTKRLTVVRTQIIFLISSLLLMFVLTTIVSVGCLAIVIDKGITITYGEMLLFNAGAFITMFAIGGICFLFSSWFNRSKLAMSVGGGLSIFFLVATILGLFGSDVMPSIIRIDAMNLFNYVSLISLFDIQSILDGTLTFLWKFGILLVVGVVTFAVSAIKFDKKDLPL